MVEYTTLAYTSPPLKALSKTKFSVFGRHFIVMNIFHPEKMKVSASQVQPFFFPPHNEPI